MMAEQHRTTHQERPATGTEGDIALAEWADFAREEEEERRARRWSVGIALALHLGFVLAFGFFGALPTIGHEVEREKKIHVLTVVRFEPPRPPQQQEIPKPKIKRIPFPDPTPSDPEPIVTQEEIDLELELPDTDIFGTPEAPPIEPEGPIHVGGDVKAPVKISGPDPIYTEMARRARVEGMVTVQAIVNKQGIVENVKVKESLPMGLDQAAIDAIKRWRFDPATLHGKPVDVYYTLHVSFRLN